MMRIALGLQYDGSPYSGWQSQVGQNTIQDELEKAISAFVGIDASKSNPIRVITAGRTDAGVHALGQVVHFDVEVERENWSWVRGVNTFLPESIVVNWAQVVTEEFSARYSAHERTYIYALHAGPCRSPMAADRAGYVMLPPDRWFDVEAMKLACECLIGEHDFTSFRSSECQSKTPVKTMYSIEIFSNEPWLYFKIKGNAFLHHMVRNLVGSFVQIGVGKQKAGWMAEVLEAKDRSIAAPTFSPAGLYLAQIAYPDEFQIPKPWLANSWLPKAVYA
ncbi:tRNA pseudouridine(38-40) synthase TruA [Polynucleobacter sp. AP-Jannik-300A-C4]|uniref:tRNA pseudouridine(38-40) synthase TruA n=1 Tax=Polynucleobacter sp. AP-Jannik-300A-C4 TaxID=2576928 RepID=UPI001BFCF014|nr:tRNA pseudouridine(38-40) synthase TruA [Polynucleobacter sp. AP-Jannik-300A-C4]QWE21735.1 tRNA pseudouridine(38-40) synthase TruA [Polynucleobacter sp. AP-Jannik-300A-C4]